MLFTYPCFNREKMNGSTANLNTDKLVATRPSERQGYQAVM